MKELDFRLDILPLKEQIFRTALRLTLSQEEAEDITQDVLLRLWERRETLNEILSLPAYAATMTQRLSLDRLAKAEAHNRSLTATDDVTPDTTTLSVDEEMAQKERSILIKKLLHRLPEKQRTALLLREIDERSYAEIAQEMEITESDAKVTIHRARQSLRSQILKLEGNGL